MLLLMYLKAINFSDVQSMKAWSYHILGAIKLIDIRGPEQFSNDAALQMFRQLRRQIVST